MAARDAAEGPTSQPLARPKVPPGASHLSSLQATLGKLNSDEARHGEVPRTPWCEYSMRLNGEEPGSVSFADSGYALLQTLGQGRFGLVKLARKDPRRHLPHALDFAPHGLVAIRVIPRFGVLGHRLKPSESLESLRFPKETGHAALSRDALMRRTEALRRLEHPNISREVEVLEDGFNVYVVMELLTGGELLSRERQPTGEARAAALATQLLSAVAHAHERGVVHQDIRPHNLLFSTADADARLVLTDWCFSEFLDSPACNSRTSVPTVNNDFAAPELVPHVRSDRSDLWSVGVTVFSLLTFSFPFTGKPLENFDWDQRSSAHSPLCKEFVASLLRLDPNERPTARQALQHPWLSSAAAMHDRAEAAPGMCARSALRLRHAATVQRAAATLIALRISPVQLHELGRMWQALDRSCAGLLDPDDFEHAARALLDQHRALASDDGAADTPAELHSPDLTCSSAQLAALCRHGADVAEDDARRRIPYMNLLGQMVDAQLQEQVQSCWHAFREFDFDGSGQVYQRDLPRVLATPELIQLMESARNFHSVAEDHNRVAEISSAAAAVAGGEMISEAQGKDGNATVHFDDVLGRILGWQDGVKAG